MLKTTRGVSFEDVLEALKKEELLADIAHPSKRHPTQRLYVIKIKEYAYGVPYVLDIKKQEIFLKTIYPSRILTKIYLTRLPKSGTVGQEGGKNEKKKKY